MRVYISPRQTPEEPVRIIALAVPPEDAITACKGLLEAGKTLTVQAKAEAAEMRGDPIRAIGTYGIDAVAAFQQGRRGFERKLQQYSHAVGAIDVADTTMFYEEDIAPAELVFGGIMVGIAAANRNSTVNGTEAINMPDVVYIEHA